MDIHSGEGRARIVKVESFHLAKHSEPSRHVSQAINTGRLGCFLFVKISDRKGKIKKKHFRVIWHIGINSIGRPFRGAPARLAAELQPPTRRSRRRTGRRMADG